MEFVIITFPTSRGVRMDGLPFGTTGVKKRVEAGHHRFDLGPGDDYTPAFEEVTVIGTTFESPMIVPFLPLAGAVVLDASESDALPPPAGRTLIARKRKARPARKRTAKKTSRKRTAKKTSRKRTAAKAKKRRASTKKR